MEGNLWLRRDLDDVDGAAFHLTHWKERYVRLKESLACPYLVVYRENKWPTPVKKGLTLPAT